MIDVWRASLLSWAEFVRINTLCDARGLRVLAPDVYLCALLHKVDSSDDDLIDSNPQTMLDIATREPCIAHVWFASGDISKLLTFSTRHTNLVGVTFQHRGYKLVRAPIEKFYGKRTTT